MRRSLRTASPRIKSRNARRLLGLRIWGRPRPRPRHANVLASALPDRLQRRRAQSPTHGSFPARGRVGGAQLVAGDGRPMQVDVSAEHAQEPMTETLEVTVSPALA